MKLQVDSKVLDALKAAFPRPERSAKRALDKYVSQLEAMLIASFHRNQSIAHAGLAYSIYPYTSWLIEAVRSVLTNNACTLGLALTDWP